MCSLKTSPLNTSACYHDHQSLFTICMSSWNHTLSAKSRLWVSELNQREKLKGDFLLGAVYRCSVWSPSVSAQLPVSPPSRTKLLIQNWEALLSPAVLCSLSVKESISPPFHPPPRPPAAVTRAVAPLCRDAQMLVLHSDEFLWCKLFKYCTADINKNTRLLLHCRLEISQACRNCCSGTSPCVKNDLIRCKTTRLRFCPTTVSVSAQ